MACRVTATAPSAQYTTTRLRLFSHSDLIQPTITNSGWGGDCWRGGQPNKDGFGEFYMFSCQVWMKWISEDFARRLKYNYRKHFQHMTCVYGFWIVWVLPLWTQIRPAATIYHKFAISTWYVSYFYILFLSPPSGQKKISYCQFNLQIQFECVVWAAAFVWVSMIEDPLPPSIKLG